MTYPISHIDGLGEDEVKTLKSVGIRTTERLLEAAKSPKGRKLLADRKLPPLPAKLEEMAPDWLPENIHSPALLVCGVAVTV